MNLNVVVKKTYVGVFPTNYLNHWGLDVYPRKLINVEIRNFWILTYDDYSSIVSFVPVITISGNDIIYEIFFNAMLVYGIVSVSLFVLAYLKIADGSVGMFDFVQLFFGQSMSSKPEKTVHRILLLTVITASVKLTNDFHSEKRSTEFA